MEAEALPSKMITMMLVHRDMVGSDASESIESALESLDSRVPYVEYRTRRGGRALRTKEYRGIESAACVSDLYCTSRTRE